MGAMNTLTNQGDGITPFAQTYVKLEKRIGILNRIKWNFARIETIPEEQPADSSQVILFAVDLQLA